MTQFSTAASTKTSAITKPIATNKPSRWHMRLSGFAWVWLMTSIIIFILAANFANNLLLLLSLIMLALMVNSAWFTWLKVRKLTIKTVKVPHLFATQTGQIQVEVLNPSQQLLEGIDLQQADIKANLSFNINREKIYLASLPVAAQQRGLYQLSSFSLECAYPLGLICWRKSFPCAAQLWVYPQPLGQQPLPKPKAKQGTYLKKEQGDFSHVRSYQRGDSLNHIAWKQMARTGDVMTKEFDGGEGLRQTWLNLADIQQSEHEAKLSQMCQWILACHQKQLKYGISLASQQLAADQGEGHKENCLKALAEFAQQYPQSAP